MFVGTSAGVIATDRFHSARERLEAYVQRPKSHEPPILSDLQPPSLRSSRGSSSGEGATIIAHDKVREPWRVEGSLTVLHDRTISKTTPTSRRHDDRLPILASTTPTARSHAASEGAIIFAVDNTGGHAAGRGISIPIRRIGGFAEESAQNGLGPVIRASGPPKWLGSARRKTCRTSCVPAGVAAAVKVRHRRQCGHGREEGSCEVLGWRAMPPPAFPSDAATAACGGGDVRQG